MYALGDVKRLFGGYNLPSLGRRSGSRSLALSLALVTPRHGSDYPVLSPGPRLSPSWLGAWPVPCGLMPCLRLPVCLGVRGLQG